MSEASGNGFTPTQRKLMDVLEDGQPHAISDLKKALDGATYDQLKQHIYLLRKRLVVKGKDLVCQIGRRDSYYLLVDRNPNF